ncbi:hypothetical protein [Streptomyces avermitilis]|uniref:hypothetical protein n=1 Tax=Streptomyces avermitilis TaxID=33903 RepID=UPI00367C95DE
MPARRQPAAAAGIAQLRRTGRYRRGTDTLLTSADGRSWISAEDLAVAVVDELETPGPERRLTVVHRDERPSA